PDPSGEAALLGLDEVPDDLARAPLAGRLVPRGIVAERLQLRLDERAGRLEVDRDLTRCEFHRHGRMLARVTCPARSRPPPGCLPRARHGSDWSIGQGRWPLARGCHRRAPRGRTGSTVPASPVRRLAPIRTTPARRW